MKIESWNFQSFW